MTKSLVEWSAGVDGQPPIVVTSAWKGGDGKSTLARELAYQLDAVLVDLDWDLGGSTKSMGYRYEKYARYPLEDAFGKGKVPTPVRGTKKADLVPSWPGWQDIQPERDVVSDALETWAREWQRPLVVDTHPGGCEATYGALNAANCIVVPTVLVKESLNALEGMVQELVDYPLLIVPNKVSSPPPVFRRRLRRIVEDAQLVTGPIVHKALWLEKRTLNRAVCSEPVPKQASSFVESIDELVESVIAYG
ncbi:ParA family protein [Streptomyces sp. NPDC048606]|uniref:ParA family protein n=1 Tax=Streptomyces sp. NPDC048606 TaxID=3154726 RepID=UPI003439A95B